MVELSRNHISVIERGIKPPRLETFVSIANALDVSADVLLQDVVKYSVEGAVGALAEDIMKLPEKERQKMIKAIRAFME